jgi:hypothetical protein
LNILIVGARSESSLPLVWWKELLGLDYNSNNDTRGSTPTSYNIRMIGPGLQPHTSLSAKNNFTSKVTIPMFLSDRSHKRMIDDTTSTPGTVSATVDREVALTSRFVAMRKKPDTEVVATGSTSDSSGAHHHSNTSADDLAVLHEHPQAFELLQWADVFVLYNPGYGTEKLQDSWDPTLRLLLETHKPILCTAYGAHDLRRDLSRLDRITSEEDNQDLGEPVEFLLPPHENPFKSFKCTHDARETGDVGIVTTNHSIYALCAK